MPRAPRFTATFFIRVTPEQRDQALAAAKRAGLDPSAWIRRAFVRQAKREATTYGKHERTVTQ